MHITLIQTNLHWEDPIANRDMFSKKINALVGKTDLIVIPEMFTTGFSMRSHELAETMDGATVKWIKTEAKRVGAVITGSLIIKEEGNYFNRLLWASPEGNLDFYDKKHLFTLASEHKHFSAGTEKKIFKYKNWKICPLICYDLRFPVWSRNTENYDLLIYVASWPDRRREAWRALLRARAIENQCYVVGVNRVGTDGSQLSYAGDSTLIDYAGGTLLEGNRVEGVWTAEISRERRGEFVDKLPFLADQDGFVFD